MNPMDLITFIQRAMGVGSDAGTALADAMKNSTVYADAADGQRMNSAPAPASVPVQMPSPSGDGRLGMNDPRIIQAGARRPAPVPSAALPITQAMADTRSMENGNGAMPDPRAMENGNGLAAPPAPVSDAVATPVPQQPGIFSRLMDGSKTGVSPIEHLLRGFTAAGSQDPAKTMMQFAAQDSENEKVREARRQANRPKFTPIGPGTVMVEHLGKVDFMPVEQAREFALKMEGVKATSAQERQVAGILAGEEAKKRIKDREGVVEAAGGVTTKPEFSADVRASLDRVDSLLKTLPQADTLPGGFNNPTIANAIDQTWGRVAGTADYEARRNADTLFKEITLSFVKKLGTNPSEGDRRFAERMQAAQDDPTSRKLALLQEYRDRTERAENSRIEAAIRRDSGSTSSPAATAPAAQANPDNLPTVNSPADLAKYKGQWVMTPGGRRYVP